MDARGFLTSVYRLAPPTERPGSQVDAAYLAAIGEVVRTFGDQPARAGLVGVETSQQLSGPGGAETSTPTGPGPCCSACGSSAERGAPPKPT